MFVGGGLEEPGWRRLYNRTGSVLLCILLHASFTPAQDHLVLLPDAVVHTESLGTIDFVILGTYVAAALVLVVLTRGRLGRTPQGSEPDADAESG